MAQDLFFSDAARAKLEPYLPSSHSSNTIDKTFLTLTFATSLDSALSLAPGTRTRLSGPESKAMTHYLRSRHDAICVGVGTVIADDPALNCRIGPSSASGPDGLTYPHQPRPIIIDPHGRWDFTDDNKVFQVCRSGTGKGPYVITSTAVQHSIDKALLLGQYGGKYISIPTNKQGRFQWEDILYALSLEGLGSVMVEGGGNVINSLLDASSQHLVDSVIVTIAPTWLGQGGVVVSPDRVTENGVAIPVARLSDVSWHPFGEDVVMCGRL
ncbi:2,5-diamino-6-(ribosylamino)-4(3H)-pyrimidinone 5'-phosphate reductase [Ceratocystis lukuohia]|uniref:2,5-diamino-6-ribosylamino-4(3H)-pyrimidinone 5'-phosphate reductase n=1 Tax=Ceratocystis lukuohia TaxID=2019550 RepID=A0ABR4MN38_9PEZI